MPESQEQSQKQELHVYDDQDQVANHAAERLVEAVLSPRHGSLPRRARHRHLRYPDGAQGFAFQTSFVPCAWLGQAIAQGGGALRT